MPRVICAIVISLASLAAASAEQAPARNVVIVTIDGLRWQEMFGGADSEYFQKDANGEATDIEKRYVRPTAEARRTLLLPFIWNEVARKGQIFGDPSRQSRVRVTNGLWFSYPGYNEILSGAADPRVDTNDKVPNPNITVLEWLNTRPGFMGKVAAFGAWDRLPFILNVDRSHLPVGSGFRPVPSPRTERQREINQMAEDLPPYWGYGTFDTPIVAAAVECLRVDKPRVMYVMLGDGDEWAHRGRYDLYLDAAQRADRFTKRLWDTVQSLSEYKGKTTFLLTTDHGRGATTKDWTDHGRKVPAAESTWIAAIGAGVAPLGVREGITVTAAQLAATIASLVGQDYSIASPKAAPALPGLGNAATAAPRADIHPIDVERSTLTVFVYKSGLFSVFADDHVIRAPIAGGAVSPDAPLGVEISVRSASLEVLDPSLGAGKRADVQARMLGPEVLDSGKYPDIAFTSTAIQVVGSDRWTVTGSLSIHGVTRPTTFSVAQQGGRYRGTVVLKQRDFGIEPISIVGGTVKVKDEVTVEFDIVTQK